MSRNNQDRLGIQVPADMPPVFSNNDPNLNQNNANGPDPTTDPLSFAVPTEMVDLPSRGKYYPEGHPLCNAEEIEIRYMTAKDEDVLNSRALLKKGIAIDRFLQGIVVNKNIKVDSLLIGDRNAIIVSSRITGYGEDYNTRVTCPNCGSTSSHDFNLEEALEVQYGHDFEGMNIVPTQINTFVVTLPRTEVAVEVRLMTGNDEKRLLKMSESKKRNNLPDAVLTDQFKAFIVAINENSEPALINKFIDLMPAIDARYLRKAYSQIIPNVALKNDFMCEGCDYDQIIDIPFTAEFFWPGQ
tara:strand:+ start:598 stop:1494 length:897 start_codon:yes stop_codon:yes gene_type:complete